MKLLKKQNLKNLFISILCAVILSSCATNKLDKEKEYSNAEQIYTEAVAEINKKNYKEALDLFDRIEREFPYSPWSTKGILMYSYLQYLQSNYAGSIASLERFVQLHPAHENIDYAYYLLALNYYDQINHSSRDQEPTYKALDALEELIAKFPDSAYAKDARVKIDLVYDHLAGQEMEIGRYYLFKNQHLAAINRFNKVVENYSKTIHVYEALYRLVEIYYNLGMIDDAKKYAAILGHNFPNSTWYHRAHKIIAK